MKLALYFTFPYPSRVAFDKFINRTLLLNYEYVELGIPTEHPYYDGPIVRRTHGKAMEEFSMKLLEDTVHMIREKGKKVYALAYCNLFENDPDGFMSSMEDAGFDGLILPDLLTDYYSIRKDIASSVSSHGLELIPFFNSTTPDASINEILQLTNSWVYFGLQPSTGIRVPLDIPSMYSRIRNLCGEREIIVGFGINSAGTIKELRKIGFDGIAVGSAFVNSMENDDQVAFDLQIKMLESETHG
ncbi:MAG: tryptophan synthase subunit alpha [Candidatus Thermoplasmatota archaeon]|jgi:tryptophan synthase alpha chain|nr:tryptophan synthase subunit alpha [Candidatus Thermoplasmatota archaeon]